jgi:hypothetical protein
MYFFKRLPLDVLALSEHGLNEMTQCKIYII